MTAECHAGKEAEARVRPQAGKRGSLEKDGGREFPGSSGADGMHPPTLVFSPVWVSNLRAAEDKCVWFGATRSVAVCHSGHRKGTQPLTLRPPPPPPPPPELLRLLLQPLPLGSRRTPRHLCSSKPPPHSSLHPVGT